MEWYSSRIIVELLYSSRSTVENYTTKILVVFY